ncbi:hypothetical protein [Streptomyces syringium]|uniref:hypothetical protein n=1 Tax=Streptomyces syringium TaxID=76729 RepID=UPI003453608E
MPPFRPPRSVFTFVCDVLLDFPTPPLPLALAPVTVTRGQKAVCTRELLAATM